MYMNKQKFPKLNAPITTHQSNRYFRLVVVLSHLVSSKQNNPIKFCWLYSFLQISIAIPKNRIKEQRTKCDVFSSHNPQKIWLCKAGTKFSQYCSLDPNIDKTPRPSSRLPIERKLVSTTNNWYLIPLLEWAISSFLPTLLYINIYFGNEKTYISVGSGACHSWSNSYQLQFALSLF